MRDPVDERLRSAQPLLDLVVGAREANILVPGWNARALKVEAADLVLLDRGDCRHLAMPFLIVAEDDPVLSTDDLQLFVIFHVLRKLVRWAVVILDAEWRLHFQQRLWKPLPEGAVEMKGQ